MQPSCLGDEAGDLLLAAGVLQSYRNVAVAGVRLGDHGVPRHGLIPVPGLGGCRCLCVAGSELLAAGLLQLGGGSGMSGLVGEDLVQEFDSLVPMLGPEC